MHSPARVVYALLVLNTLAFIATLFGTKGQIAQQFGLIPATPHLATLFTHMFVHAGFWHLFGNMFFLWMFGDNVEDVLGHVAFAITYLGCGLMAALGQYFAGPHSLTPMVGASGAISGVMALYVIFFPRASFDLDIYLGWWKVASWPATSKAAVLAWFGEQLVLAALTSATHSIGIAFWAHVGGFVGGAIFGGGFLLLGFRERYQARISAGRSGAGYKARRVAAP